MAKGENVVANMAKHDNNQLPLHALSTHVVRTSIEDNKIIQNVRKYFILAEVSAEKLSPWSDKKFSEKYASVERSGWCNSRFKIYKYYMFITICQLTILSYIEAT